MVKTRFIVDMLRSGINALSKVEERIVLPGGSDLIREALDVQDVPATIRAVRGGYY